MIPQILSRALSRASIQYFRQRFSLIVGCLLVLSVAALLLAKQTKAFQQPAQRAGQQPVQQQPGRTQAQPASPAAEEVDPDMPPFARGLIEKREYLDRRQENVNLLRGLPYDQPDRRIKAIREMERQFQINGPLINTTTWTEIGPSPIPNGQTEGVSTSVSGRTTAIAIHPTNPNIVYVGTAQGGVYRTLNGGASWTAIFDSALSLAIGSIAIAPSNPTIVYVGTGEPNSSCDSFFGVGIYRINNADTSPVLNGPFNSTGAADVFTGRGVGRVVVHPTNPDIIFASTTSGIGGLGCEAFNVLPNRGLFRSTNATGACTFTQMTTTGNASHVDVAMDPANPDRALVTVNAASGSGGGIYLSTDALAATPTFTRTLTLNSVRSELALHSSGGTVTVYEADGTSNGNLRKSVDGGATWSTAIAAATGFCGGQCFYNISMAVAPNDANVVLLGGNVTGASSRLIARSTNGGTNFTNVASGVHADNHAAAFAPSDSTQAWIGTDGGIYKSTNGGASWTSQNKSGFMATQFMSVDLHPTDPRFSIGGTQDNGTNFLQPNDAWTRADFGDGGYAVIDQNAANTTNVTMYHTYFNQTNAMGYARVTNVANAVDNGWTFFGCGFSGSTPNGMTCTATAILFYAPMTRGPGNPNTLYFGSDVLYRSINSGTTMTKVSQEPIVSGQPITAIGIAPSTDNVRIVGLRNGTIWRTTTGSSTLTNVTGAGMPARFVGRIVIDPTNPEIAYVGYTGFGVAANQHVWKTTNLSNATPTWTASGSGIPDVPVNAMAIDPANPTHIYAGTDIGVYRSIDGGATWLPYGLGLPRVAVFDMKIQDANRILRIATHGRGLWEIQLGCPTITLNPTSVPFGFLNTPYTTTNLVAAGGASPYTFTVTGSLPTGITLSGAGVLAGTPTASGTFMFTARATDNAGCFAERTYTLEISPCAVPLTITPATLPSGFVSVAYNQPLTGNGGTPSYTFALEPGSSLPPGVNIVGSSLAGTPTTAGLFNFVLRVTDSLGCFGTQAFTVAISGTGLQFYPLAHPVRLLETRPGQTGCIAPGVQIPGGTSLTVPARGTCDGLTIPANAAAVTGNITTVQSGGGYLTVYPSDVTQPVVANSNYTANQVLNNVFTVGLGAVDGAFKIFVTSNTNVVVDITGYYAPPGAGGLYFHPLPAPVRLLETRNGFSGCFTPATPLPANQDFMQQGNNTCGIPSSARALVGNATTVNPQAGGYLTIFPADATRPLISSGNYLTGQTLNSPFTVGLSPSGQFKVYTVAQTDLVIDVLGYYSMDALDVNGQGLLFSPMVPARLLETRSGFSGCFTPGVPIPATTDTPQAARGVCTISASAQAIVGNATVVNPTVGGFLTFWPSNAARPTVATSNYQANTIFNRHFTVGLGVDGAFKIYAQQSTHLVVDVSGSFAP
ncbi:MAG: putative Ig domain-containing protein [Blastocatellia bacterium]